MDKSSEGYKSESETLTVTPSEEDLLRIKEETVDVPGFFLDLETKIKEEQDGLDILGIKSELDDEGVINQEPEYIVIKEETVNFSVEEGDTQDNLDPLSIESEQSNETVAKNEAELEDLRKGFHRSAVHQAGNEIERICHCKHQCRELNNGGILELLKQYYSQDSNTQKTYLMGLITIGPVLRRRHGRYEAASKSRRQNTIYYNIPDWKGNLIQVCKVTFMNIFAVSKKRLDTIIQKKKKGCVTFTDERSTRTSKISIYMPEDRKRVIEHILSNLRDNCDYNRTKTCKKFPSLTQNITRLHIAFNAKFRENKRTAKSI